MINLQMAGVIDFRYGPQLLSYRCQDGKRLLHGRLRVLGGIGPDGVPGESFVAHHVRLAQLEDWTGMFLLDVYRQDFHVVGRGGLPNLRGFHRLDVVGNLGSDPHRFDNGDVVFPVAGEYSLDGKRQMLWISIFVAAGTLAEMCQQQLVKGDLVASIGYLRSNEGGPPMGNGQVQYQMDAVEIEFFWRGKKESEA